MPEHPLDALLGPVLTEAGFSRAAPAPERTLYTADIAGAQSALLTVSGDSIVLRTFVAPAHTVGYEHVGAARSTRDGYELDEFDGSWTLVERTSDYLDAEFPRWATGAPAELIDEAAGLIIARTVAIARYGAVVAARLAARRAGALRLTGSPELSPR